MIKSKSIIFIKLNKQSKTGKFIEKVNLDFNFNLSQVLKQKDINELAV